MVAHDLVIRIENLSRKEGSMAKGGKVLKPVNKSKNPGLAKLPTQVRNKMGYMKKGGRVMSEKWWVWLKEEWRL